MQKINERKNHFFFSFGVDGVDEAFSCFGVEPLFNFFSANFSSKPFAKLTGFSPPALGVLALLAALELFLLLIF